MCWFTTSTDPCRESDALMASSETARIRLDGIVDKTFAHRTKSKRSSTPPRTRAASRRGLWASGRRPGSAPSYVAGQFASFDRVVHTSRRWKSCHSLPRGTACTGAAHSRSRAPSRRARCRRASASGGPTPPLGPLLRFLSEPATLELDSARPSPRLGTALCPLSYAADGDSLSNPPEIARLPPVRAKDRLGRQGDPGAA